ncbi:MAG: hypothetical protein COC09_09015 [Gammaproteobacteria bacterium]|nr:GIY-YIG nuclease family protein [Gammaproteobacteria bacterium]PCH62225.1 MAG: hypothetical protein COC09_09015 [Gammaproteobacteria bacterium]
MSQQDWFVYIIRAADNTLYTGVTTDVSRRFEQHSSGKGAKYLKGRTPIKLVFQQTIGTRSKAQRIEHWIKQQPKQIKERITKKLIELPD